MAFLEVFRRRHLPHWDVPGATYFVTACLEGSIPAQGLLNIKRYEASVQKRPCPAGKSKQEWDLECWKRAFARVDRWLDLQPAVRHLADPQLARIVVDSLYFFAGKRYDLLAFSVMPSHFHWVFRPLESWVEELGTDAQVRTPRERIMHSVRSYTANQCNRLLTTKGRFWQQESYDHWIRDVDELERIMHYVEQNPVKAALTETPKQWPFSSAWDRSKRGIAWGQPLTNIVRLEA